jgi:hypothetical protein
MTGILNISGLNKLDPKKLEFEYHVKAEPAAISRPLEENPPTASCQHLA